MNLKDYAGFREFLVYHGLYYEVDIEKNEYVVLDKNGNTVVNISSNLVRNNYEAARDILVTAVNTVTVFGGN